MSHTAVFPLLTVDRNKFMLSLFVCICEFRTGIMTFSHVYTFFRGTHSIFYFSVAPVVRVKMWGSFTVTAEEELWHGPLCSLCLLSWPSCFEVWMAVVMNAALFIRTLTVEEGGWLCSWQCFLLSLCVQIQIQETHTKGPEPLNPVLWLTQTLFVDLNFPTALDTVVKSFISASGAACGRAVKKPFVIVSSVVFCKNTLNFILIILTRLDWFFSQVPRGVYSDSMQCDFWNISGCTTRYRRVFNGYLWAESFSALVDVTQQMFKAEGWHGQRQNCDLVKDLKRAQINDSLYHSLWNLSE